MKRHIVIFSILAITAPAFSQAQSQTISIVSAQTESNQKTTGNKEDVLTNYLQVAANNLTSNTQNVTLKLNWFALNMMDSTKKYNDDNYQHTRWQRNGQFLLGGGMDKNERFNSVQAGLSYNVLNLRDTNEFHYFKYYEIALQHLNDIRKKEFKNFVDTISTEVQLVIQRIAQNEFAQKAQGQFKSDLFNTLKSFPANATTTALITKVQDGINTAIKNNQPLSVTQSTTDLANFGANDMLNLALNKYVNSFGKQSISFDTYVDAPLITKIAAAIDKDVQADPLLQQQYKAKSLTDADQQITNEYHNLVNYVSRQPLLTAAINGNYGTGTSLSNIGFGLSGIWGLNKLGSTKTNQLTVELADTLTGRTTDLTRLLNRDLATLQGGINTVLLMNKKASVMELNLGVEDDLQLSKVETGDEKNKFTFNGYYRVRLIGSPWLKLMLKYDPKAANVLGLLNFTYNLDNSTSSSNSKN